MSSDTPTKLVSRRIHAVLTRAKAAHHHAAQTAAAAYATDAAPPPQTTSAHATADVTGGAA